MEANLDLKKFPTIREPHTGDTYCDLAFSHATSVSNEPFCSSSITWVVDEIINFNNSAYVCVSVCVRFKICGTVLLIVIMCCGESPR